MSLWTRITPGATPGGGEEAASVRPRHLDLKKDASLTVHWMDGRVSVYPIAYLRRFSPSAAEAVAEQLVLTAQSLLETAGLIAHDAPIITEDWTGRLREVFDVDSARFHLATVTMADDLLRTAAVVRARAEVAMNDWVVCQ